ncbi:MAG TPA: tetratricopeptide repeat protein [Roseiflexaceae bacterium]|nr:tetratricopeptide repeat protein [Roseiflexaceae bacterium]HMP38778.1 tetratricopeptide repeat protein [Roseiflexaceae bacterium]
MANDETTRFHRQVAETLAQLYRHEERAPEGWREAQAWHWEQAGAYAAATDTALVIAELRVTRLDFAGARQWAERALALIERLPVEEQHTYELRAYTLALSVLEFGGQYREGYEYARRMLRAAQRHSNREAEIRAVLAIGRMQRELGQLTAAEQTLAQARIEAERDEFGELETDARLHLAKVHQLQGRHLEALQELQLAREENEQIDDKLKLARVLTNIGDIYRVLGSSREASGFYTRALVFEQGRGSLIGQAILREKLALVLLDQNKPSEALTSAEEGLRIRERLHDVVGQARSYTVIGTILSRLGRHSQAMSNYERARDLQELTQNPRGQSIALVHLGDALRALRQPQQASDAFNQALTLARRDNDQIGMARALERLGDLAEEQGQPEMARGRWNEALRIRETLKHVDEAVKLRNRMQQRI